MVNWNGDTTVATPPTDVLKISILERRSLVINSIESYYKLLVRSGGRREDFKHIISSINSVFLEVRSAMENDKEVPEGTTSDITKKLYDLSLEPNEQNIIELDNIFLTIDRWMYKKKITKVDGVEVYNKFRIENTNRRNGY